MHELLFRAPRAFGAFVLGSVLASASIDARAALPQGEPAEASRAAEPASTPTPEPEVAEAEAPESGSGADEAPSDASNFVFRDLEAALVIRERILHRLAEPLHLSPS